MLILSEDQKLLMASAREQSRTDNTKIEAAERFRYEDARPAKFGRRAPERRREPEAVSVSA